MQNIPPPHQPWVDARGATLSQAPGAQGISLPAKLDKCLWLNSF